MKWIVDQVKKRGLFKSRTPEGNAGLPGFDATVDHEDDGEGEPVVKRDNRPKYVLILATLSLDIVLFMEYFLLYPLVESSPTPYFGSRV